MMTPRQRSNAARQRYWRVRARKEVDEMRRSDDSDKASPKQGWVLIVRRQVVADGMIYPVGSVIPSDKVRNLRACVDSRQVMWGPKPKHPAKPRKLVVAPDKRPTLPSRPQIIESSDPLTSWQETRACYVRVFDGQTSKAVDWLLSFPELRALYLVATRVGCEREAKRIGKPSVPPNMVEGLV
jgi:hypothetical protein